MTIPIMWSCSSAPVSRTAWSGFAAAAPFISRLSGTTPSRTDPFAVMREEASVSRASDSLMAGCDSGYNVTARAAALMARAKSVSFAVLSRSSCGTSFS